MHHYPHDPLVRLTQGKKLPKAVLEELTHDGYITDDHQLTPQGHQQLSTYL